MDTDLRASLVSAAAAAVLSALVGIIAGVGVIALLLRAILGGSLFGALVYGGIFVARRSLPGLSRAGATPPSDRADGEGVGRAVDIVLPDEIPAGEAFRDDARREDARGGEGESPLEPAKTEPAPRAQAEPRTSRADEVRYIDHEEEPEYLEGFAGPEGAADQAIAVPSSAPGPSSFDDLDVLPDLEGFSDSFAPAEFHGASVEPAMAAPSRAPVGHGTPMNESLDPVSLAHAVRTILKRDQKG